MSGWHRLVSPFWPCGHARTVENTQSVGVAGLRCRVCRRVIARDSQRRRCQAVEPRQATA